MGVYLAIALLVAFPALFWLVLKVSADRIEKQYRVLAERFGLEFDQAPPKAAGFIRADPSLYGDYRGREVSFSAPGKGIKGTRQIETVLKVELRDRRLRAQLAPTGFLGSLAQRKSDGQARWKSGDAAFDQAVDVRTDQARIVEPALTPARRAWLAGHLKASKATLYIGNGTIAYARLGLIANDAIRRSFEEVVEFLCDFAEAVEE